MEKTQWEGAWECSRGVCGGTIPFSLGGWQWQNRGGRDTDTDRGFDVLGLRLNRPRDRRRQIHGRLFPLVTWALLTTPMTKPKNLHKHSNLNNKHIFFNWYGRPTYQRKKKKRILCYTSIKGIITPKFWLIIFLHKITSFFISTKLDFKISIFYKLVPWLICKNGICLIKIQ